jgi:hypothetical protein
VLEDAVQRERAYLSQLLAYQRRRNRNEPVTERFVQFDPADHEPGREADYGADYGGDWV